LSSSITGKNWTGDGGASIFFMASTAIASGPIVLGFLTSQKQKINTSILFLEININILLHRPIIDQASHAEIINLAKMS
jgi:hypothetical protein